MSLRLVQPLEQIRKFVVIIVGQACAFAERCTQRCDDAGMGRRSADKDRATREIALFVRNFLVSSARHRDGVIAHLNI